MGELGEVSEEPGPGWSPLSLMSGKDGLQSKDSSLDEKDDRLVRRGKRGWGIGTLRTFNEDGEDSVGVVDDVTRERDGAVDRLPELWITGTLS